MAHKSVAHPNVVGVYRDYEDARGAIDALELIVDASHISLAAKPLQAREPENVKTDRRTVSIATRSIAFGAIVGAIVGLALGVLIAAVWLALDSTADATLWIAAVTPMALLGGTVGAVCGFAIRVGFSDAWVETLRDAPLGSVCVGVNAPNHATRVLAKDFMRRAHALDVKDAHEFRRGASRE